MMLYWLDYTQTNKNAPFTLGVAAGRHDSVSALLTPDFRELKLKVLMVDTVGDTSVYSYGLRYDGGAAAGDLPSMRIYMDSKDLMWWRRRWIRLANNPG